MKRLAVLFALLPSIAFAQPAQLSIEHYEDVIRGLNREASQIRFERDQLRQRVDMLTKQIEASKEPKKEPGE